MSRRSTLALAVWLSLAGGAVLAQMRQDPSFNLVNRNASPIRELYVTPAGDANWGRNRLQGGPIPAGGTYQVRRKSDGNCIFDIRVVFADGRSEERRGLNTCAHDAVAVGGPERPFSKTADDPSFRLINRGATPIVQLYATPAGLGNWGRNRLGANELPPDATAVVRIPPTSQCLFDLRVVFAGHKALEKRRTDLCKITDLPVP